MYGRRRLILVLLCLVAGAPVQTAHGGPERVKEDIAGLAQLAFSSALERFNRLSFRYRHMPKVGRLPLADGVARLAAALEPRDVSKYSTAWTDAHWDQSVERARVAWNEAQPRGASEMVRIVHRRGNVTLDIDEGLEAYRIDRLTASCSFQSPDMNLLWSPVGNQLVFATGNVDAGQKPNAAYFLMPTALGLPGMHKTSSVSVINAGEGEATVLLRREATDEEYSYRVIKSLSWLPTEAKLTIRGKLASMAYFDWMTVDGVGIFPAAVARLLPGAEGCSLRLSCFSSPRYSLDLPSLSIPAGTVVADERVSPSLARVVRLDSDLEQDWAKYVRLGSRLPVPPELLKDTAGAGQAPDAGPPRK